MDPAQHLYINTYLKQKMRTYSSLIIIFFKTFDWGTKSYIVTENATIILDHMVWI